MSPLHETKHVVLNGVWHWEAKCGKCGRWVLVSDEAGEGIKSGKIGMACVDSGEDHWITFIKDGEGILPGVPKSIELKGGEV